ncbi:MAG: type II toxin-antitoxin system RelE/ParE family toxin, partial [Mesorhizobium sp.]
QARQHLAGADFVKRRDTVGAEPFHRLAVLDNPRELGKPLKGPLATFWRYRVGDYRVICDVQDRRLVILVVTIGHRGDVYR